jgi:hypothetical protein
MESERTTSEVAAQFAWTQAQATSMLMKAVQTDPAFAARISRMQQQLYANMQRAQQQGF